MSEPIKTREELEAIREDIDSLAAVSGATALRLLATIDAMAQDFKRHQWSGTHVQVLGKGFFGTCPECAWREDEGHAPHCALAPWVGLRRKTHGN